MTHRLARPKPPRRVVAWPALSLLLFTAPLAQARQPAAQIHAPAAVTETVVTLNLAECIHTALERQPRIAVERASLAAAEEAKRAIDNLRLAALVDREIPIRRKQACLGITAAAAGLHQAESETVYAVTRAYFTVLYAREQVRVAHKVVEGLSATHDLAEQQLKGGARDVSASDVRRALVYLRQAQAKQVQASEGVKRALASLKEAIGLGCEVRLDLPPARLPDPDARPCHDEVVALALSRRAEVVQVNTFSEATCLEVEAQQTSLLKRMDTFAAGADIHARPVPQTIRNSEYRPGAVAPEMPTSFVGSRSERARHAALLHERADAAAEVVHNLITLEADDAYLRWEEAAQQVGPAREAADAGDQLAEDLARDHAANLKVKSDEVINARVLAAQSRASYNDYLYHKILALADLERVTAGGFCARLVDAAPARLATQFGNGGK